jgi:EAL domain-containing protein (putative c-di-GMP-specific phosphodiesterase class I)
MIFAGNFIISVTNFKDYLQIESKTKAQDTATSLGVRLKPLLNENINDPEIELIISAIANSGFYKEIRLEIALFEFSSGDLLNQLDLDGNFKIKDLRVDPHDGILVDKKDDNEMADELAELDGEDGLDSQQVDQAVYTFIPAKDFPAKKDVTIFFTAYNDNKEIKTEAKITINKIPVKITREEKFDNIPQWFMDMLPLHMVETKSEIAKWKTQAIIYVSANAGDAYAKLYDQAVGAIYYAIVSFTIAFGIFVIFLNFILKPLKEIEQLAKNITDGNFETIEKLPWTTELRNVSISMNTMSNTIKNIIGKLNNNLEKMTEQLSKDGLTGLQLEQTFNTDMKQMFIKKIDGYVFSIKIDNFGNFAKNNPHKVVDQFLKDFANILKQCENAKAYRFFGSTFAMISYVADHKQIEQLAKDLKYSFEQLGEKYNLTSVAHIGATPFNPISTTDAILAQANEAYEMAKQIGYNEISIRDKNDLAKDMLEWKDLVVDIIQNHKFKVGYINQAVSMDDKKILLLEEAFTSANDNDNKPIAIGTFISIAEKYDMIIDFDKAVITQIIKHIEQNNVQNEIAINLAFDSLMDSGFKNWVKNILTQHKQIASQLVFSVTAYGCVRDTKVFKEFIELVHKYNGKILLKRFETKFIPLDTLKEFQLDYIRLARDYTNGIANDASKQSFVELICELAKLINIKVFAESVKDDDSFVKLKELGLYGSSK